jgi:hypothetical protein
MSGMNEFLIGVAGTAVGGALGWVARPIFDRPQRAMTRAFAGDRVAIEVQTSTEQMSDISPLFGPVAWIFGDLEPAFPLTQPWGIPGWQAWAYANRGEDVHTTIVQITIQGLSDDPISVEAPAIDVHRVLDRRGHKYFGPGGLGGGGVLPRNYLFEIDGEHVTRTFVESHGRPEAFQLAAGETERLIVRVNVADDRRHEWGLQIPYVRRGRRHHIVVRNTAGSLFVTNGSGGLEHWINGDRQWIKAWTPDSPPRGDRGSGPDTGVGNMIQRVLRRSKAALPGLSTRRGTH